MTFHSKMPRTSLISIVLPVYNGSKFLPKSVQSCIEQTWQDWELIIVDDCSTDTTPEIIQSFVNQDVRIRSVRHETNRRLPAALNTGFALARGDFLTWTSDDNIYRSTALETMLGFLNENPGIDLVYTDYSVIDENSFNLRKVRVKEPPYLAFGCNIGPCFLYRRDVSELVGEYDPEMFYAEDYDYWLRAARYFNFSTLHNDQYLYREHSASLTAQKHSQLQRKILKTKSRNVKSIPWVDSKTKARAFLVMMNAARAQRAWGDTFLFMLYAVGYDPGIIKRRMLRRSV